MNRNIFLIIVLLQIGLSGIYAQKFYVKPKLKYNFGLTTQEAPQYFNVSVPIPANTGYQSATYFCQSNKFSLAEGVSPEIDLGYRLSDVFGLELGVDYFSTDKTFEPQSQLFLAKSRWEYSAITMKPALTISKEYKKSAFIAKLAPSVGIGMLKGYMLIDGFDISPAYRFVNTLVYGYALGFEYNYQVFNKTFVCVEAGTDYSHYTPESARLMVESDLYVKNYEYVNQITDEQVSSYNYGSESKKTIRQTIVFNRIYLAIALKYNL